MDKIAVLNLAQDALRHIMKEKRKTCYFPDKRVKLEEKLKDYDEAIGILEGMKPRQLDWDRYDENPETG